MDHDQLHSIFHKISRFTIILPIVIIALGIMLKPETPKNVTYTKTISISSIPSPSVIPTSVKPTARSGTPINLVGPQVCNFQDETTYDGSFYIKNKKIYGEVHNKKSNVTSHLLLQNDCVYKWSPNINIGQKMCNLSKYISIFESMASLNLLTAEDLIDTLAKYGNNNITLQNLTTQCRIEQMSDSKFQPPSNIKFTSITPPVPPSN